MNKNDQEFLVQKIRTQYTEKEHTQLDELKALDSKVKKPARSGGVRYKDTTSQIRLLPS